MNWADIDPKTRAWVMAFIVVVIVLIILATLGYINGAWAEDYWTNCDEAYRFCKIRPYHRDCSIWTQYGKPLISNHTQCPIQ